MRALIIVMLAAQAAVFLATTFIVLFGRPDGRRPPLSSLAVLLVIVASTSWTIADKHVGEAGADVLAYGSPMLLGMGLMAALVQFRRGRGTDAS